jgi:DNA polymerase I
MARHEWTWADTAATVATVRVIETELGPVRVASTPTDAAEAWSWLGQRAGQVLGLDSETNAHDPFSSTYRLRTVQMADSSGGWVLHVQRPGMAEVVRTLVRAHDRWAAWFARNDLIYVEQGLPGAVRLDSYHPHIYDGQPLLAYYDPRTVTTAAIKDNIDPRIARQRRLKPAAALRLGNDHLSRVDEAMHVKFKELYRATHGRCAAQKEMNPYGFEHIDDEDLDYLTYAGLDGIVACRMWELMYPEVCRRGQQNALELDLRLQWHYDLMCYRGQPVDGAYVKWLDGRLDGIIEENRQLLGYYGINPSASGPAIGRAFSWLSDKGFMETTNTRKTGKGKVSWDKVAIQKIIDAEPTSYAGKLAIGLQAVRKATKFRSSYVKPLLVAGTLDGRAHPDLRAIGTISSRNAAMRPPLQQAPKREKKLRIRTSFIAPPGWVLVTADLEQGEPRVMAGLSGDKALIHDLLHGDLYSSIASLTYGSRYLGKEQGKTPGTESYAMRQNGKFSYLAWSYSCGADKLASLMEKDLQFSFSVEEAKAAIQRWERAYPDLIRFRRRADKQPAAYLESGWVAPLWDRYFVDDKGIHLSTKPSRLGLNYYTQGTQRYLFATAIHRIIDAGWSWALYWVMHDEILLCVPAELADQAAALLKWAMTMDFHGVPITCDVDKPPYSTRWADYPEEYNLTAQDVDKEIDDDLNELFGTELAGV